MSCKVSVLMSVYNENEEYIHKSILSILNQSYNNIEFIIVLDDPGNNSIKEILQYYKNKDNRITLLFNDKNMGLANSLNRAINISRGEFIARMDSDDISVETRIEKQMKYLLEKNLDMVFSSFFEIDRNQNIIKECSIKYSPLKIKKLLPYANFVCHPSVLIKSEVIKKLDGYRNFERGQDYDLWLRLISNDYKIGVINEPLLFYRRIKITREYDCKSYYASLIGRYQQLLYKQRLKYGEDRYSEENLEKFLISEGYYDDNKKDKYNKSHNLLFITKTLLRQKKYIKAFIKLIKALSIDFSNVVIEIYQSIKINIYRRIL